MFQESIKNKGFTPDQYEIRKEPRKTYILAKQAKAKSQAEQISKIKDMPDPKIIYAINFGQDAMIIVSKTGILVYSLFSLQVKYSRRGFFWDAAFIPDTCCLAVIEHDGTTKSKKNVKILDIRIDQIICQATISFQIEVLKASKHCIALGGVTEVAVVHFPTLKPICHEITGTGLNNIFDISYEGLTLAYQCQSRGMIIVHNFTQMITNQARRKSSMSGLNEAPKSQYTNMVKNKIQKIKQVLEIKAHKQNISLVRLSPTGNRVATASNKGTLIRIFLTTSGKLWEQLRVGYQLCKILDMNFFEEGNVIACLTEKNIVQMYNIKLQQSEKNYEKQKRGYDIYQQKNPKSFFSFLSFFYSDFNLEYPFAFKQLVKPPQKQDLKKQGQNQQEKQDIEGNNEKKSEKQIFMPVVLEEEQEQMKPAYIEQREQNNNKNDIEAGQKDLQKVLTQDIKESEINQQNSPQNDKRQTQNSIKIEKSSSSFSRRHSQFSTKIHKKNSIVTPKQASFIPKVFNTVHKVYVGGNNFIWAVKGSYLFTLKYDPFNGGQMYHKDTMILHK